MRARPKADPRYEQLAIEVPDAGKLPDKDFRFEVRQLTELPGSTSVECAPYRCHCSTKSFLQLANGKRKPYCATCMPGARAAARLL